MKWYTIGDYSIRVSGKGLDHIDSFQPFKTSYSSKEILTIKLNTPINDWKEEPLYSFMLEGKIRCEFIRKKTAYLFRIEMQDEKKLLVRLSACNGKYYADTNMNESTETHFLQFAIWLTYGIAAIQRYTMAVHASTIICSDRSVLFLGESGTGKSTHTQLWLNYINNTELLNDDSPLLHIKDNKVVVYGSPWSGKTPCYKNNMTQVAAIVRISQAPHNKIKRLCNLAAIGALQPSCPPAFTNDDVLSEHVYIILSKILSKIPVYSLECLPNADAAHLVYNTLKKEGCL